MALEIYNTLRRGKAPFQPLEPGRIRMYVCGNTVYDYAHIGHARVMVAFDAIVRYLRSQGWDVTYVRNFTDIDDKILNRARENSEPYTALTARMIAAQHEDERALGVLPPDIEPRATEHIEDIIDMVQTLLDNHYAYLADNGDIYYRISRFPEYGKLSGKNPEELLAGARVEVGESKEDPRDFVLWKAAKDEEPGWDSPWGRGRPGWHIECSAMSTCHLGATFDIHGGGPDLPFPHHENEIAQSEAATGKPYVNVWMHAGAVRVDNEKMSKSLGNFFTIRDVLTRYNPEVVRFFLLSSHYRSPINYSEENLAEARGGLDRLYGALREQGNAPAIPLAELCKRPAYQAFVAVMDDDFNTREAISLLFDIARDLIAAVRQGETKRAAELAGELKGLAGIIGLLQNDPDAWFQAAGGNASVQGELSPRQIEALIEQRLKARRDRDFARADQIREDLLAAGIILEDSREGTKWRRQ